ncbi:MAG: aldo/keto reductase [Mycoplasma sp.]|nr:aldo/keto reductase [Mycoplasma sp.]
MLNMKKIKLLDGNCIPQIGLGTWQINPEDIDNTLKSAISIGYKHIDTAQIYNNEYEIGGFLKNNQASKDLFITTKVWPSNFSDEETFLTSIKQSLKRLNLETIDLLLLHWPINGYSTNAYKWLEKAKDLNYCKSIGVSNFMIDHLKEILSICKYKPVINQIEFNPLIQQKELIQFCFNNNIQVVGYSNIKPYLANKLSIEQNQQLKKIAQDHQKTVPQIILRWVTQENIIIIPKSTNTKRLVENFNLFDFELSDSELEIIRQMDRNDYQKAYKISKLKICPFITYKIGFLFLFGK